MRRKGASPETKAFEDAIAAHPAAEHYVLRLFVTGTTPRSARAIENIRALCEDRLQGRYDLEVIDIYQHPENVVTDQIVVTPTLVKKLPLPFRKIIGDLSEQERVLVGLDLIPRQPRPTEQEHGTTDPERTSGARPGPSGTPR